MKIGRASGPKHLGTQTAVGPNPNYYRARAPGSLRTDAPYPSKDNHTTILNCLNDCV